MLGEDFSSQQESARLVLFQLVADGFLDKIWDSHQISGKV